MSSRDTQFGRNKRLPLLAVALTLCTIFGCSLFTGGENSRSTASRRPLLPPIQTAPDAIQIELLFVERPAEDYLLTTGLWKEIDQIGALPAETREKLQDNGFRIGHASSNPPPAVQKLLGMVAEVSADVPENARPLMGRRQYLSPGVDTEIPTSDQHEHCEIVVRDGERVKSLEYDQVGCVLRMKALRLQDGWVRVDFQPEIHHGDKMMRRTSTEDGWSLRGGQNIDVRHSQRFSLTMNVGELALITGIPDDEPTLGDRFFCRDDRGLKKQRVLIVRVIDSGQAVPSYTR